MATIVRKETKKGTKYQAQVRRKGHADQWRTFRRLTDARKWARRIEENIERYEFSAESLPRRTLLSDVVLRSTNRAPLVDAVGEPILDQHGEPRLGGNPDFLDHPERDRKKTIAKLDWWIESLGDPTLDLLLDGQGIRKGLEKLRAGAGPSGREVSAATSNRYLAAIRGCLSYAVERRMIPRNPAKGIRHGRETERVRRLDSEERRRLLEVCERSSDQRLYPLVLLALATGGRAGELLGLRWRDLDFERGRVLFLETKNYEARGIGVSTEVLAVLRDRLVRQVGTDLVFADLRRRAVSATARFPRGAWERALEEAKVEDFRFHDCRHDFASRLAVSGATLAELAEALGHKTLAMVKRYSHLCEGHIAEVTRRASEALLA